MTSTGTSMRVDDLVIAEHNKVRHLWNEYQKAPTTEVKQQLGYMMIHELSVHSSKEEEVLYPVLKKVFGKQERDHLLKEHTELKQLLAKLGQMKADKDEQAFDKQVEAVIHEFNHHVKHEEEEELPQLAKDSDIDMLALGKKFEAAGAHAVTRPHTWAPDKAPLNVVTNAMTKPLDTLADAVRFAGNTPEVPSNPTTRAA
jgi:iron-sulfur cluster repair protein YtfE (RIC family)